MKAFIATLVTAATLLSACTTKTLTVTKVDASKPELMTGAPYPLMFTQYQVNITRQVTQCFSSKSHSTPEVKVLVKAEIASSAAAPDPKQMFVLDTNSLAGLMKTSEVKLEYHPSGAVASLNAVAEDRTAAVVSNAVGSVVKLFTLGAMKAWKASEPLVPLEKSQQPLCVEKVAKAIEGIDAQRKNMEAASALVESTTADLKKLLDKVSALAGDIDARTRTALNVKYDALSAAMSKLKEATADLEKRLKVTTDVQSVLWPSDGDDIDESFPLPALLATRWFTTANLDSGIPSELEVYFALHNTGRIGRLTTNGVLAPGTVETKYGVPYRLPVSGVLRICSQAPCGLDDIAIVEKKGDILQFGHVMYLPCKSRPFTSIGCTFSTTEDGKLKSMGTAQKSAPAEGATGALKDLLTQAAGLKEELDASGVKKLEAETALLKAKAENATAKAALVADPYQENKDAIIAITSETELLNARLALIEAEAALREAMGKAAETP